MAVSVVAGSVVGASSSTSITKPTSAGYTETANDIILVCCITDGNNTGGPPTGPALPTGFTSIETNNTGSGNSWMTGVWGWKLDSGSESWPLSWTQAGGTNQFNTWSCVILRGNDTTTPVDAHTSVAVDGTTSLALSALTASVSGDALVIMQADGGDVGISSWPTGVSTYSDATNAAGNGMNTGTKTSLASGSTGSLTTTTQASPLHNMAAAILVKASSGGSVNGSSTIRGLAGILGGLAGMGILPGGIAAGPTLGGGLAGMGATGGGLAGQGEITASSTALDSATLEGVGNLGGGVSGQGALPSGIAGQAALGTGQSGSAGLGGGLAGQGLIQAASAALASATFQGLAGFIEGFGGRALISATGTLGGAVNGAATILGIGNLLGGMAGRANVNASSAATPSLTLGGTSGLLGGLAGVANLIASSIAAALSTLTGTAGVGTGQSGNASLPSPRSAATPSLTLGGVAGFLGGFGAQALISATGHMTSSAKPFFFAAQSLKQLLNLAFGVKPKVTFVFGATQVLNFSFSATQKLNFAFSRSPALATPNTTITVTVTATDQNGAPVSNLSVCTVQVTFPDGTQSQTYSLVSTPAIQNLGSGKYSITYNTKTPGENVEDWHGTDSAGNICEFHNITPVSF